MTDPAITGNAPPAEPPRTTQPVVNDDGSFAEGWYGTYGENNKAHLSRYKTFDDLVNSHLNTKSKLGIPADELVRIPKDDSPDDVKLAWKKANGWSENLDDYKYELDESLKTKVLADDAKLQKAKEFLQKELELNPAQVKKALDYYYQDKGQSIDDYNLVFEQDKEKRRNEGQVVLRKHLGSDSDIRAARAQAVFDKFAQIPIKTKDGEIIPSEKLFEEFPGLTESPWMTMIFNNIAESMSEDSLRGLVKPTMPTPQQIDEQITKLRQDPAYLDRTNPNHKRVVKEVEDLYIKKASAK